MDDLAAAQPSADDLERTRVICPGPTDTVEARHYTEPLIPEQTAERIERAIRALTAEPAPRPDAGMSG